jgi:general secretion pathway protein H
MQGRNGFTLVELLVVLFIIALMSAAVLAALPDPGGALTVEAERFAARVSAAQERAVMDNRPIAIRVDQAGYAFDWREAGEWRPIGQRPFDARGWQQGTTAEVGTGRILFDSTGFSEARQITLARGRDRVVVEISNGGHVHVRS